MSESVCGGIDEFDNVVEISRKRTGFVIPATIFYGDPCG